MIYGIGHDIVENLRIAEIVKQTELKFIARVLSPKEQDIYFTKNDKVRYLAKRFAAKEAFAKACHTGIVAPILMPNIIVLNDANGRPYFEFSSEIQGWLNERKIFSYHLSLSDEHLLSSAFVILEY